MNSEDGKVPLYVGLIQSYDPSRPDAQLDSIGTIVGTEIALDHINADERMLPGYRLHYSFVGSQVCCAPCLPSTSHQLHSCCSNACTV